eukprot:406097-Pelagomonas_calceolata.AAC.3
MALIIGNNCKPDSNRIQINLCAIVFILSMRLRLVGCNPHSVHCPPYASPLSLCCFTSCMLWLRLNAQLRWKHSTQLLIPSLILLMYPCLPSAVSFEGCPGSA